MNARSSLCLISLSAVVASTACGAQVLDVGSDGKSQGGAGPAQAADPAKTSDGANASPTSACVAVGASPTMLAESAQGNQVRILVPEGETLWLDGYSSVAAQPTQGLLGNLASVPVAGGAPTQLELDRYRSIAGIFGGKLVYVRTTHEGTGTKTDPRVEEIVVRDRATGTETVLQNPRSTTFVGSVIVHPSGIYWLAREWDALAPEPIVRWNGSTVTELTTLQNHSSLVTDGTDVFYVRWSQTNGVTDEIRIEAAPIAGGAPRVLRARPYDKKFFYQVVGAEGGEVYFTEEATPNGSTLDAGDLRAMKKNGTSERVLVSGQKFGPASIRIDPDFVSWTDQDAQQTIVRVRRSGGITERIEGLPNRWVSALAVDRCNIYYAVNNPSQIFARSRLP